MSRVMVIDKVGESPQLMVRDMEPTNPGPNEIRIRVHAIGLNRADLLYLQGDHYTETVLPSRLGFEAAGVIDAVGTSVTKFEVGDRVTAIPHGDPTYSVGGEFAIIPEKYVQLWPSGFSAAEAAGAWMQYLTAYFPLKEIGNVGAGDFVLVTAASSSAGLGAIQLAKALGAKVVATTRTSEKEQFLLASGADRVVVVDHGNVADQILAGTDGGGVRVVYDAVGGRFMSDYAQALEPNAQIFAYGMMGGSTTLESPILPLVRASATIHAYSLINYLREPRALAESCLFVSRGMQAGHLRPRIDKIFDLEDARDAYSYMESGMQRGKIVLHTKFAEPPTEETDNR